MTNALKPLMFVGTASDVGKSSIATGFCRLLKQDGYQPAPFKAQNMSLNSYVTPNGLEIGRAQAVQAEAAGIDCSTDMNPVLLKPTNEKMSQLVLHGKPAGNQSAYEYFMQNDRSALWEEVKQAYDRLSAISNPVVMEGAGSISEINLKRRDIVNMRMALHAGAAVYLVADIDKGGVFGSVYGTLALLPPEEKALIKGVIINKFRGDARLFEEGKKQLEQLTGVRVAGVLPYYRHIHIEEEDSVALQQKNQTSKAGAVNIAIVLLPHLSNFTDFLLLEKTPSLHVYYTGDPQELLKADIVIIPGSKNTIADLLHIQQQGIGAAIQHMQQQGKVVIGICGGYQMMGITVADPYGVEGEPRTVPGLSLLPVHTVLAKEKTTLRSRFRFGQSGPWCEGYEIHMGQTTTDNPCPLTYTDDDRVDGYYLSANCWGTYMHGILDNRPVVQNLLQQGAGNKQVAIELFDYQQFKQQQYDLLADHIRQYVDIPFVYETLKKG